jgi:hypothetical protein
MPASLFLSSDDLVADRRFEFARDLQLKGDLVAGTGLLEQAVELAPDFSSAWLALPACVHAAIETAGLELSQCEELSARNEDNVPAPGLVVVAAKR